MMRKNTTIIKITDDPLAWLLDKADPGVRYLALRDLIHLTADDEELKSARKAAHKNGPIAEILNEMNAEGYWIKPGTGYSPKYKSTVWSVILLGQLGALASEDSRIIQACKYILDHTLTAGGQFCALASGLPSGTIDCLQGNLCWALSEIGCDDPRLKTAFDWMARSVTGEGVAPQGETSAPLRYYAYNCGPLFACGANNRLPCAWGGTKVMLAFGKLPHKERTPLIRRAIQKGLDFLLSVDPSTAGYPNDYSTKPSASWWKFGFPVFYVTDLLQIAEALAGLGCGSDSRLHNLMDFIQSKKDDHGRWPMEHHYTGKMWVDFGHNRIPNKWVTLRARRVLQAVEGKFNQQ